MISSSIFAAPPHCFFEPKVVANEVAADNGWAELSKPVTLRKSREDGCDRRYRDTERYGLMQLFAKSSACFRGPNKIHANIEPDEIMDDIRLSDCRLRILRLPQVFNSVEMMLPSTPKASVGPPADCRVDQSVQTGGVN